ncbi:MAG: flagellar hook-basal body complex protein FliE [Acidimicrobiia bacterium]|nr:flagellar hook-basal body complex protein FliE [Acidimicrobiia bacterium]
MAILPPIAPIAGAAPTAFVPAVKPIGSDAIDQSNGVDFGKAVTSALENLQASHTATDKLAEAAATGDLKAIEDYMIMATETQLATELTVAVRTKAIESFNEIMRMQV